MKFIPSPEQRDVITHTDGHLQVIACAGSGKTEAMARRVAFLIEQGVEPGQIIAFTFTVRAANSLRERISRSVAESKGQSFLDRLGPLFTGTIHSFCLKILQDHVPEYGDFDTLDERRLAALLSREHKRLGLDRLGGGQWESIRGFVRNANVIENELINPELLKETAFGDCYLRFREMLRSYRFLTYGLQIAEAVNALSKPGVFKEVHGELRHLIVDEYQDINPAQEKLIRLLSKPPVALGVVADDDQAIYQWRGSDVGIMLEFSKRFHSEPLHLSINRRSRPKIIAQANRFAETISPRMPKAMKPSLPSNGEVLACWSGRNAEDEAKIIADTIERLQDKGFRCEDIAILYRSVRTSSPPLIEVFKRRGIPYRCAGSRGLFLQPVAQVSGMVFAWLSGHDWRNGRTEPSEPVHLDQLVTDLESSFNRGGTIVGLGKHLEEWKNQVAKRTNAADPIGDYYKLLRLLGVHATDLEDPESSGLMAPLGRFTQLLADFEHVALRASYSDEDGRQVFRAARDHGPDLYRRLSDYLRHLASDGYGDLEGEDSPEQNAVSILTVHQAKGLEWPVVFVPSVLKRRFPSSLAGRQQEWLIPEAYFPEDVRARYEGSEVEERRVFYVALTRPKDAIYLSGFLRNGYRPDHSPFLVEMAGGDPPVVTSLPIPDFHQATSNEQEELPILSFSSLARYESCPLRFRFSHDFAFQPPRAVALGYGRSIQHILRRVADHTQQRQALPKQEEVGLLFEKEFFLPLANRATFHNLRERGERLLRTYLKSFGHELLRVWDTHRAWEIRLENGIVSGRADVIIGEERDQAGGLAIIAYKTSRDPDSEDTLDFQLAMCAGASRAEGLNVKAAYLQDLNKDDRREVPVDKNGVDLARMRASHVVEGIVARQYPARPEQVKCGGCDMRHICKFAL